MKTKLTKHFFSVVVAEKYDMECAVILENLFYWVEKNRANEKNKHEGLYWTYNSMPAFQNLFPYLSEHKIRRVLKKLEKENVITTGNFNKTAYDRTKWYAITEYGYSILKNSQMQTKEPSDSIPKKPQMETSKTADGNTKNRRPIPNSKPNNKPNKEKTQLIKNFFASYNQIAKQNHFPIARKLTQTRKKKIGARIKSFGKAEIRKMFKMLLRQNHLRNESWFNLDYVIKNDEHIENILNDWLAWKRKSKSKGKKNMSEKERWMSLSEEEKEAERNGR